MNVGGMNTNSIPWQSFIIASVPGTVGIVFAILFGKHLWQRRTLIFSGRALCQGVQILLDWVGLVFCYRRIILPVARLVASCWKCRRQSKANVGVELV